VAEDFPDIFTDPNDKFVLLKDIADDFDVKQGKLKHNKVPKQTKHLFVFGRVLAKAKAYCFAKIDTPKKWPFQCSMILGSKKHTCEVVFWEEHVFEH